MSRFRLIVGEVKLLISRLLIVNIARITAFKAAKLSDEYEITALRYVENRTRELYSLWIERTLFVEFYLIKGLGSGSECLVNISEHFPIFKNK